MNYSRFATLAISLQFSCVIAFSHSVYSVNTSITSANPTGNPLQTDTINGSITTDGKIGVIGPADIVSYNLNLIDGLNAANNFDLTTSNSSLVEDLGGTLTATATGLFFNFSGSGEFDIQANNPGPFSGSRYFCLSTGLFACAAGETISPQDVYNDGVITTGAAVPVGSQPLNPPSGVPEPSTYGLMMLGVLGVGTIRARRARGGQTRQFILEHDKTLAGKVDL